MTACEAITVATVASTTIGIRLHSGKREEERVRDRLGVLEDQRALAEVVEHQRREDEEEPRAADRRAAEVAHVGVQRLGAGDGEHHRAEREERRAAVVDEELDRVASARAPAGCRGARRSGATPSDRQDARTTRAITGPNRRPTAPVPKRWIANSTVRIASAIGTTSESSDGDTTSSPSTAESTEIAGVIMPSP